MKMRKRYWRDAACRYLEEYGPSTSQQIFEGAMTKGGKPFKGSHRGPNGAVGASQLLKTDPRITGEYGVTTTIIGHEYKVKIWRLKNEKSQTDTE